MMVEAFICQVAGHGGSEQIVDDAPPSFPHVLPDFSAVATASNHAIAAATRTIWWENRCEAVNTTDGTHATHARHALATKELEAPRGAWTRAHARTHATAKTPIEGRGTKRQCPD